MLDLLEKCGSFPIQSGGLVYKNQFPPPFPEDQK